MGPSDAQRNSDAKINWEHLLEKEPFVRKGIWKHTGCMLDPHLGWNDRESKGRLGLYCEPTMHQLSTHYLISFS